MRPSARLLPGRLLLAVLVGACSTAVLARPAHDSGPPADGADALHQAIGRGVRELGDRLDRFFADRQIVAESQTSTLRLSPSITWREAGATETDFPARINIVLPRLERQWQLRFSSFEDRDDDLVADRVDAHPRNPDAMPGVATGAVDDRPTSTFVTLNYTPVATARSNVSAAFGPKLRNRSVDLFSALRLRYSHVSTVWKQRVTQTFFYDGDEFGERTRLEFDRPLSEVALFRLATTATYTETSPGFELVQSLILRRFLNGRHALQTSLSMLGDTRPVIRVQGYALGLTYRQQLWKRWLQLSLRPVLRYPRENSFSAEPELTLALQATF